MNNFFKHAFVMLSGSVIAQAIPLLMMPVLTRLYSPSEFGVYNSLIAISGILSIVACLRYDLAIVLQTSEKEAASVTTIALASSILINLFFFVILYFVPSPLFSSFSSIQNLQSLIFLLPLFTLFMSIQQVFSFVANRERQYRLISFGNILLQAVFAGFALLMHGRLSVNELVVSRFMGVVIAAVFLITVLRKIFIKFLRHFSICDIKNSFFKYRQFPLYNVPYSFAGVFSRDFLILVLTSFGQLAVAGQLGLARTAINAPIYFLSASLSQVFYREAAENHLLPEFKQMVNRIFISVALICIPLLVWGLFWGEELFVLCFGTKWREAGHFAQLLMPIGILSLFTSWPERIFEVKQRQRRSLAIQLIFDTSTVAATYFVLSYSESYMLAISVYVLLQTLYHIIYLHNVIQLVGFSKIYILNLLTLICFIILITALLIIPFNTFFQTEIAMASTLIITVLISFIAYSQKGLLGLEHMHLKGFQCNH